VVKSLENRNVTGGNKKWEKRVNKNHLGTGEI